MSESEFLKSIFEKVVAALEAFGVAVIVAGIIWAVALYVKDLKQREYEESYRNLRSNLGRGILVGLELLVAADIISTVSTEITYHSIGLLAIIVVIRTFLSFSLETEIEGKWPWERHTKPE